jgi:uncharacterized protein YjdB
MKKSLGVALCLFMGGCNFQGVLALGNLMKPQPTTISQVTLDKTSLVLNVLPPTGEAAEGFDVSAKLTATVSSRGTNQGVTWSSSDPTRASVSDDGTVTAGRGGAETTIVITATSKDDATKLATASVKLTTDTQLDMGVD